MRGRGAAGGSATATLTSRRLHWTMEEGGSDIFLICFRDLGHRKVILFSLTDKH